MITTATGLVVIENIHPGDMVLAANEETGEVAYKEVVRTFVNTTDEITHVTIENAEGEQETIDSTPEHPFYVEGLGWVEASALHPGMTIWYANGTKGTVEDISNEGLEEPVTVYNFEVKDFHTYFVGESGVLVHNVCGVDDTIITPEMEEKILHGQRKDPAKNQLIGGHSPDINNSNPNYAVEVKSVNPDGTKSVKFVTQYSDGNLSNIKNSTLFPDSWDNEKIISSIKSVGSTSPIGVRSSDGATLYRGVVDGVQIEVIKVGNTVTSGYPTGGSSTGVLPGFEGID